LEVLNMNDHIFKYEIPIQDEIIEINLPKSYALLDIQSQGDKICMWCLIDTHEEFVTRKFVVIGTGWKIDIKEDLCFMKTVQMANGLVWHIFRFKENE